MPKMITSLYIYLQRLQVYIFIYKKEFNIILDQSVYYDE